MGSAVLVLAGSWSAGVALAVVGDLPLAVAGLAVVVAACAAAVAPAGPVRLAALGMLALLLGLARGGLAWDAAAADAAVQALQPYAGPVVVSGRVVDAPQPRGRRVELTVEVQRLRPREATLAAALFAERGPRLLVRASAAPVAAGDLVEAAGVLARPRSRPGWPLAELLARRGVHWVLDTGPVRVQEPGGPSLVGTLTALRQELEAQTRAVLPEPHASLMAGMVFGARAGLPPDLRADLSATGTSHLTAVSGLNVAIVAGALLVLAARLAGRWVGLGLALVGVWLYTLLVGAPPSALRAAMMASCALAAQAVGRRPDATSGLALAVALLLGWDPGLAFDLGFQLSVAATAGLILLSPSLDRPLGWLPKAIREPAVVALAAQLSTLPLVLPVFQSVSVVALPANILAAPLVIPIMALGVALALLAPLPGLGVLLGWASWLATSALLLVVEGLADVPGAVQLTGRPPAWLPLAWYAVLACWVAAGSADVRALGARPGALRLGAVGGVGAILLGAVVPIWAPAPTGAVEVTVLEVEQGAALVRSADGATAVLVADADISGVGAAVAEQLGAWEGIVDLAVGPAGPTPTADLSRRVGAGRIVVATEPGADHASGEAVAGDDSGDLERVSPGGWIELGTDVRIAVVDVRVVGERRVADLAVLADDLAVWLPGPGPPSANWPALAPDAFTVLRLPASAVSWVRTLPPRRWVLLIGGAAVDRVRDEVAPVAVLDLREYGSVRLHPVEGGLDARLDRCEGARSCLLRLGAPPVTPGAPPVTRPGQPASANATEPSALQSEPAAAPAD